MSERRDDRRSAGTTTPAADARTTEPKAADGRPPAAEDARYSIGDLADELQVTTRAIRFYEAKGLITPARKGVARAYTRRDRARLLLILRGKNLGFSLKDIQQYLVLYDADPTQLAQLKLLETMVEAHIAKLKKKRADLDRTLKELADIKATVTAELAGRGERPKSGR